MKDYSELLDMIDGDNLIDREGTEWRPLWEYPGYFVSEDGRVASTFSGRLHVLKSWPNQYGHRYVGFSVDGPNGHFKKKESIHRLVAGAFLENPRPGEYNVVRHLDDDPENNEACNLAWGTQADNHRDCVEHGREFSRSVYCFETDRIYRSCVEAALDLGVSKSLITMCCQGRVGAVKDSYHLCYLCDKDKKEQNFEEWLHSGFNRKPVVAINVATGDTRKFWSRKEAAEALGLNASSITNVLAGRLNTTGGWTFRETEE